ncbi:MAG TPA: hypothetical protein VLA89_16095 [Gemmatimonadales bacterium]|nr:hypothetical protein [Gemmatimonadales bacterium]
MTKAKFIRWASRREKAANCLRNGELLIKEMQRIAGADGGVVVDNLCTRAVDAMEDARAYLARALELVASPPREGGDNG